MSTLSNGIVYHNASFPAVFGEYLISNGFSASCRKDRLTFYTGQARIYVDQDNAHAYKRTDTAEGPRLDFAHSFAGLNKINLFGWIMLLHTMAIVDMGGFLKTARSSDDQLGVEAHSILRQVFSTPIQTCH